MIACIMVIWNVYMAMGRLHQLYLTINVRGKHCDSGNSSDKGYRNDSHDSNNSNHSSKNLKFLVFALGNGDADERVLPCLQKSAWEYQNYKISY